MQEGILTLVFGTASSLVPSCSRMAAISASSFSMRSTFSSLTASKYWQEALFLSHRWQGRLPSQRTLDVRQLTQALMARRLRGRGEVGFIGNLVRERVAWWVDPVFKVGVGRGWTDWRGGGKVARHDSCFWRRQMASSATVLVRRSSGLRVTKQICFSAPLGAASDTTTEAKRFGGASLDCSALLPTRLRYSTLSGQ